MADTSTSTTTTGTTSSPTSTSDPPTTPPPPPTSSSTTPPPTTTPTTTPTTPPTPSSDTSTTLPTSTSSTTTPIIPSITSQSTQTSLSTTIGGGTVTLTSVVAVTPTKSLGPTGTTAPGTSKTFFQNTGAVAGVFTVVGLIVVGLLIALVTNTLRRRRAKRFDREIEEAAAEAAAVPAPAFLDDDDDHYGPRAYAGGPAYGAYAHGAGDNYGRGDGFNNNQYGRNAGNDGYSADRGAYSDGVGQYSDASSHGTYGQPPMSTGGHGEAYGMRELGPSPGVGELYNPHGNTGMPDAGIMAAGAGAAGIGVMRARSTREPGGYANALSEGASPYPAFATAGGMHGHPHLQQPQQPRDYNNIGGTNSTPNAALLDAAGMGVGPGPGGLQRGISLQHQPYPASTPSSYPASPAAGYSDLSRNQSLATGSRSPESYASHYESATSATSVGSGGDKYNGFGMPQHIPQQQQGADLRRNPSVGHSMIEEDPYGGYEPEEHGDRTKGRYADGDESSGEEDEGQGRRVLKVANQ